MINRHFRSIKWYLVLNARKTIVIAAAVGLLVPVLCGIVGMMFFSAKGGGWEELVALRLPNFICPPWALGDGRAFWMIVIPLLNALLYASVAATIAVIFKLRRVRT